MSEHTDPAEAPEFPSKWHYDAYVAGVEREIEGAKTRLLELKDVPGAEVTIDGLKTVVKNAEAELERVRALNPLDDDVAAATGLTDEQLERAAELVNGGMSREDAEAQAVAETEGAAPVEEPKEDAARTAALEAIAKCGTAHEALPLITTALETWTDDDELLAMKARAEALIAGTPPTETPQPDKPLDEMKLPELCDYARKLGLDFTPKPGLKKDTVREAIDAKLAEQA